MLPFKWPFVSIPFLPDSMYYILESPVPFVVGVINNKMLFDSYSNDNKFLNNIIFINENNVSINFKNKNDYNCPYINNFKSDLYSLFMKYESESKI